MEVISVGNKQCPVCAANLVHEFGDGYNYYDCMWCHFRCDERFLLRITAAMDLANTLVSYEKAQDPFSVREDGSYLDQSRKRVIKIWE